MSARGAHAAAEPRRHRSLGALAAALPERRPLRPAPVEAVEPLPRRRRRRRPGWHIGTVAGVLLFVALFAVAGFQTLIIQQQAHIDDLNDRIAEQEAHAEDLRQDVVELESPQRINEWAQAAGMERPQAPMYLQPRPDDDTRAAEVPSDAAGSGT